MGIFGVVSKEARGHVVTTILIGLVAHAAHGHQLRPHGARVPAARARRSRTWASRSTPALGYVTGWSMVMDYVLNPIICTILCTKPDDELPALAAPSAGRRLLRRPLHRASTCGASRPARAPTRSSASAWASWCSCSWARRLRYLMGAPLERGRPHPPVLRSGHVLAPGRADRRVHRLPDLHRLRRHLDALRGGREPAAQHHAGHRAHLPDHRRAGHAAGLRGAARVGRLDRASQTSTPRSSHVAGKAGGPFLFGLVERLPADRHHRVRARARTWARRACSTGWAAARALPRGVLRRHRPEARASPATTCSWWAPWRSSAGSLLEPPARGRDAQLRRLHRLHGREPGRLRALLAADAANGRWSTSCCRCWASLICAYLWYSLRWQAKVAGGAWLRPASSTARSGRAGFKGELVSFEVPPEEPEPRSADASLL